MGLKREDIVAVVVTYNPPEEFFDNLQRIKNFYKQVIIVDNTEENNDQSVLEGLCGRNDISVLKNRKNLGIARALNQGTEEAKKVGAEWVTTFDQDSELLCDLPGLIKSQPTEFLENSILGASYVDPEFDHTYNFRECFYGAFSKSNELISSGMSYSIKNYDLIGGFDSDLFIDMVDHDFCIRAKLKGLNLLKTSRLAMKHSIGAKTKHRFLWKTLYTSNHPPIRRYFLARNSVILAKKFPVWRYPGILVHCYGLVKVFSLVFLFEKNKYEKLVSIFVGAKDGFLKKRKIADDNLGE